MDAASVATATVRFDASVFAPQTAPLTRRLVWLAIALCAVVFFLDLLFPLGVAAGVPYAAVMLVTLWMPRRARRFQLAVASSILTVVGFFIPFPEGAAFSIGLHNREIALFSIWTTTLLADLAVRRNEALGEREARMRGILDAAVDAIVVVDDAGRIDSCNLAALRMFGYTAREIVGREVTALMPPETRAEYDAVRAKRQTADDRRVFDCVHETLALKGNGTEFPVEFSLSEVQLPGRRLFTAIVRDVTDRRQTQQRLLQAERLAAIGQAMTGLAHESRNSLQRSQACIDILRGCVQQDPEQLSLIHDIQSAQDDLHRLYEEVREYASPVQVNCRPCRPAQIACEAWEHLERERTGREAALQVNEPNGAVTVQADCFALRQLFRNLLENALCACRDPVQIRVEVRAAPSGVGILVIDNGPGVPAERAEQIFQPFYTTRTRGTGLGLAICRRMVAAHGGEIGVRNAGAPGAEFFIFLPGKRP